MYRKRKKKQPTAYEEDEKDYYINWNKDAASIKRHVNSAIAQVFEYLRYRTLLNNELIIIDDVEEFPDLNIVE